MLLLLCPAFVFADADLAIVKTATNACRVGSALTYRLAVTNKVTGGTATNVVVTDVLPAGVDFVSCSPSAGTWSQAMGTVYCNLGNLNKGATAAVTIVVNPTLTGMITNQASVSSDTPDPDTGNNRASAETTVGDANRAPEISLPGPHIVPVGCATTFPVTVTDSDHDTVSITNTVKPSGATYAGGSFSWTASVAFLNTTQTITFVADDGQGQTNSIVTNSTTIVVPFDADGDSMSDGWEWTHFATLTNAAAGDRDGDGADNYTEYVAGTQPTNTASKFHVMSVTLSGASNHQVRVTTEPGRRYTIYYADGRLTNGIAWRAFANPNWGVWTETASASTNHIFSDNESTNTTSGSPSNGGRCYRIKVAVP